MSPRARMEYLETTYLRYPYRKGMPPWEAFEEILENAGRQFDPEVVEASKRVIQENVEKV